MMAFMFVEFTGPCCLCGGKSTSKRGGVGSDERGGIMCCPCAVKSARGLLRAVDKVKHQQKKGLEFKDGKWRRPKKAGRKVAP